MRFAILAALMLLANDSPRMRPAMPDLPRRSMEEGNRHARRRDRKLTQLWGC